MTIFSLPLSLTFWDMPGTILYFVLLLYNQPRVALAFYTVSTFAWSGHNERWWFLALDSRFSLPRRVWPYWSNPLRQYTVDSFRPVSRPGRPGAVCSYTDDVKCAIWVIKADLIKWFKKKRRKLGLLCLIAATPSADYGLIGVFVQKVTWLGPAKGDIRVTIEKTFKIKFLLNSCCSLPDLQQRDSWVKGQKSQLLNYYI